MPDFRRGAAAIEAAQQKSQGGAKTFRPFAAQHFWKSNNEEKYLLFLNRVEDIPTIDLINFIPVPKQKYFEQVIARTDPAIGESSDAMVEDWDGQPKEQNIAVAVELEVDFEEKNGRKKPVGFSVKMNEFDRRVRDEDGELTDEYETVASPAIGFITQSPNNFFNAVTAYDQNDAPIEETPLKITRLGTDTSTTYGVAGYDGQEVDLTDLLENIEFYSYVDKDDIDGLYEDIDNAETDRDAGLLIGAYLLGKRLEELSDKERYDEIYDTIDRSLDKFGNKNKGKKGGAKKATTTRAARPSQRASRRAKAEAPAEDPQLTESDEAPADDAPDETPVEEPKAKTTRRRSSAKSDTSDPLKALRERAEKKKAEAAAAA